MSQSVIGNLRIDLAANTAAFAQGLAQAQKSLSRFGAGLKAFAASSGAITLFNQSLAALKSVADMGDLAESIGVTAEQLQVYQRMAIASGTSSDVLARGLMSIAEQSTDTSSALGKLFEANGLTVKGKTVNEVIRQFMELVQNARTPAEQLSIITGVLGDKVGRQLVESFRTGAAGVDEQTIKMRDSGNYLADEQVKAAQRIETKYNEMTNNISIAWQSMVVNMISEGERFWSWLSQTQEAALAQIAAPEVAGRLESLRADLANAQAQIANGVSGRAKFALEQEIKRLQSLIALYDMAERRSGSISQADGKGDLPGNINPRTSQLNPVTKIPQTGTVAKSSGSGVPQVPQVPPDTIDSIYGTGEAFSEMWARMSEGIPQANEFKTACMSIADTMSNTLGSSIEGLITGTMDLKDVFKSMSGSITQELTQLSAQLTKSSFLKVISMLAGKMFGGVTLGSMSFGGFYANGGTLGAGQWGIAGEAGPEIIHGPARVTPMNKAQAPVIVKHTVLNYGGAKIEQQERTGANGERELLTIIDRRMASQMSDPYSPASSALDARGARIAKKRR